MTVDYVDLGLNAVPDKFFHVCIKSELDVSNEVLNSLFAHRNVTSF